MRTSSPSLPDRSGWTPHASERRDFLNRIRTFPPSVAAWRRRMLARIRSGDPLIPLPGGVASEDVSDRLDAGISYLREVARILAVLYGTPDLGNKPDPTDELVYIILSRKTPEEAYQEAFNALKTAVPDLGRTARRAPRGGREACQLRRPVGQEDHQPLRRAEDLRETFGSCTLEPAREWSDEKLEAFLCGLPEIQRKSAYCIMMYSFGRQVFPADTHVGRVLSRLGPYRELGLDAARGSTTRSCSAMLAELIPPNLRYSLHVNLVEHGRAVCRSPKPLCDRCELRNFCRYYRRARIGPGHGDRSADGRRPVRGGGRLSARASPGPGSRCWPRSRSTRWRPGPTASTTPACRTTG